LCVIALALCPRHQALLLNAALKMHHSLLLIFALISSVFSLWGFSFPVPLYQKPLALQSQDQHSIMDKLIPGLVKPQSTAPDGDIQRSKDSQADGLIVSDVLPKTKGINIYARLTRDFEPIASRLNDASKNITVLAPRNSAIQALPRKPWENPEDYSKFGEVDAYEGQEGQDRAKRNLQRFVEAHLIPVSPWRAEEEIETLAGEKLTWNKEGDKIVIQPGNIQVDTVAEKVSNGEVWVLNGVVNYR
ncbi:hypothetical protein NUU61_000228, partial [Penicillium alfredii]